MTDTYKVTITKEGTRMWEYEVPVDRFPSNPCAGLQGHIHVPVGDVVLQVFDEGTAVICIKPEFLKELMTREEWEELYGEEDDAS